VVLRFMRKHAIWCNGAARYSRACDVNTEIYVLRSQVDRQIGTENRQQIRSLRSRICGHNRRFFFLIPYRIDGLSGSRSSVYISSLFGLSGQGERL
jgi:hypothetical protein